MKKYLLSILALAAFACSDDESTTYSVDPALETYVTTFYNEASARGVTIPQNLVAEYSHKAQSIASARREAGQNYLYVSHSFTEPTPILEYSIFQELGTLFVNKKVVYSTSESTCQYVDCIAADMTQYNRDTFFDKLFE